MRLGVALLCLLLAGSCTQQTRLPVPGSDQYRSLCTAFYLGLAALQSGEDVNARKGLTEATRIAPQEPAGWLNLGLLQFRQQDFEGAYQSVSKALTLVPENSRVEALLGIVESRRGKQPEALSHLTNAVRLDPHNLKASFALAGETERQNAPGSDAQAQQLLEQILAVQPNNLAVLIEDVRLAAKRNDPARVRAAVTQLQTQSTLLPDAARQQLTNLADQARQPDVRPAAVSVQFLKNVLVRAPAYRQSLDEVRTPATSAGEPFLKFFKLPSPSSQPDPPDTKISYQLAAPANAAASWSGIVYLDGDAAPQLATVANSTLHIGSAALPLPGPAPFGLHSLVAADLNYDFSTDIILATASGLRMFLQTAPDAFEDVSAKLHLPAAVLRDHYTGAWAFDYDLDGDLDIVLGRPAGAPLVLRNNGDGTFRPVEPFQGVSGLLDFASADVDGDGDADVALIDGAHHLVVFRNERLGDYRQRATPITSPDLERLAAADVNGDGLPDFVALTSSGRVLRLSDAQAGKAWTTADLLQAKPGPASLLLADLDNNGALDLVVNSQLFLGDGHQWTLASSPALAPACLTAVADLNGDGVLDLVGIAGGNPASWLGASPRHYGWQTVRPRAARTGGDQRMNSFGIGGEIELRAELLTQKQIITAPRLHFGMGTHHTGTEFARIEWPNGLIQTEFGLKKDGNLLAEQRLKGSCPYLFAWNGREMAFVKDVAPMSGAWGSHDIAGGFAPVTQTAQSFLVSDSQLQPSAGIYRLSVTDEYWETYFVDRYSLTAYDHPAGTYLFIDERVSNPPAPLTPILTGQPRPFVSLSNPPLPRATYRGLVSDHFTEMRLPDEAPLTGPLFLIAHGWLRPWDDSVLMAAAQGAFASPSGLQLQVSEDGQAWRSVPGDLGVPAGRNKTVVLPLTGLFHSTHARKLRLCTNLEIYWDRLAWAPGVSSTLNSSPASLTSANLQHRGFSAVTQQSPQSPELPHYNQLVETGDRWRPLDGYYTRYGEIAPLLAASDDRYAIVNSGDELTLTFSALPDPAAGYVRDFVFNGDGWIKEGDYGFRDSQTVLPLPSHAVARYPAHLTDLERDPVYLAHRGDWSTYHTRYISSERFWSLLWH